MKVERVDTVPLSSIMPGDTFELIDMGVVTTYVRTCGGAKGTSSGDTITAMRIDGPLFSFDLSKLVIPKKYKLVPDHS